MTKNILVTGGTGFVGSNIVNYFINKTNYNIIVIDRTLKKNNQFDGVTYIEFDLKDHLNMSKLLSQYEFDYIFHQGAIVNTKYDNDDIYDINTNAINSVIELANKSDAKVVYASSCAVYGNTTIPNKVGLQECPLNKYAKSKYLQDNIVLNYLNNNGRIPITGLRYSNIYGYGEFHKGDMSSMIYQVNSKIKNNEKIKLFEYGEQKRDFIYIDDVVEYNISSAYSNKVGVYNAGFCNSHSFNDMMRYFDLHYKKHIDVEFIKNPYSFYQNHTLAEIDKDLYVPTFNLYDGMNDYLNKIN